MRVFAIVLCLAACDGATPESCTALSDGEWTFDGPAMGMAMGATVSMDAEQCEFTFSGWSMEMSSLPIGGTVDGTTVTLDGDAHWSSCTGTVADDGASAEGTCADDGSGFTMLAGAFTGS